MTLSVVRLARPVPSGAVYTALLPYKGTSTGSRGGLGLQIRSYATAVTVIGCPAERLHVTWVTEQDSVIHQGIALGDVFMKINSISVFFFIIIERALDELYAIFHSIHAQ